MKCVARLVLLFTLIAFAPVVPLFGFDIQTFSPIPAVDINMVPTNYSGDGYTQNYLGGWLWASGQDTGHLGWTFEFLTGDPIFSQNICTQYDQRGYCFAGSVFDAYGAGGSYTLKGPNGELYTATIVDGWVDFDWTNYGKFYDGTYRVTTNGLWNDSSPYYVAVVKGGIYDDGPRPATVQFTPEPGSLVLLGSGVVGFAAVLRRRIGLRTATRVGRCEPIERS